MHIDSVEIFSDATNAAIMRHPGRRFPGLLVQGDTLYSMYKEVAQLYSEATGRLDEDSLIGLEMLRDDLHGLVKHYYATLVAHGMALPFPDV